MAGGPAAPLDREKQQTEAPDIPLWLTLQRCRGIGWLHASRGGCLGLGDSGRGAAVFSRVVLVPPEDTDDSATTTDATAPGMHGSAATTTFTDNASSAFARKRSALADATLHALDNVAAVEVEAGAEEAALEGGYGDGGGLFAALLSPSVPNKEERNAATSVQGEFLVMHHMQDETPQNEDAVEELHLCFGELLWHPTPPRLFACRSLWSSAQHMRLTKSNEEERLKPSTAAATATAARAAAAATAAAAAAADADTAADGPVFVLTDVEETETDDAAASPLEALRSMRGALADREAFHRAVKDTFSLSASSIRHSPETFARLANAATDVLSKASADWVALGTAAFQTAAAAGRKVQRFWKEFSWGRGGESSRGKEPAS
ncbi:hypothetical protein Emed_002828 [Eimeria media]